MSNCRNCGAPVDLSAIACPYCDTPYCKSITTVDQCAIDIDYKFTYQGILKLINGNCIAVNEARRIAGLEEIHT